MIAGMGPWWAEGPMMFVAMVVIAWVAAVWCDREPDHLQHFDGLEPERRPYDWQREPTPCTGLTASWCPTHGACSCPDRTTALDGPCALHDPMSEHPL